MATQAEWRKAEGITQQKLAAMLSAQLGRVVNQSSVNSWEHGTMPGADCAEAVRILSAGAVGISTYGPRCRLA